MGERKKHIEPQVQFCDAKRSPLWANISVTGAGPRVDGYMFVTDREGLRVIQSFGVFQAFEDKWYIDKKKEN
jgi:hypothetical protein